MLDWFSDLDAHVQTALLAGVVTVSGIILKDIVISLWTERRSASKSEMEIYRKYADPLAFAATSLFWRLREIFFDEGRGAYLKVSDDATDFERYKQVSTMYRLASFLAWIRAYRRELAFFPHENGSNLRDLRKSIDNFESALADGADVEEQRVLSLLQLWQLELPEDESARSSLFIAVEQVWRTLLHREQCSLASDLSPQAQNELCRNVADIITGRLGFESLPSDVVEETKHRAIRSLSIREGLIYRDYQAGIGDLLICDSAGTYRSFDVLGFRDFEQLVLNGDQEEERWVGRIRKLFYRLDVSGADRFDARVHTLEKTLIATAELIKSLGRIDRSRGIISRATLRAAEAACEDLVWRRG